MRSYRGLPFAICFALLLSVWYDHYKYFRHYGLRAAPTVWLNSVLLFLVLLYVYPLQFLFISLTDPFLGFGDRTRLPGGGGEMIETSQIPPLMIHGAGFIAVQLVFALFCWRAYSLRDALARDALALDAHELSVTREEARGALLNVLVGVVSVGIATFGGRDGLVGGVGMSFDLAPADHQRLRHALAQDETLSPGARWCIQET